MTASLHRLASHNAASRIARLIGAAALGASLLTGCYVVPMQPGQALPPGPVTVVPAGQASAAPVPAPAPAAQYFNARLYPSNAEAARYGTLTAVVSNEMNGRGHFSVVINGEAFQGEATRAAGSERNGVAHAAGVRGGMLSCRYVLNSPTQGMGNCVLNNGPSFAMHIGG